MNYKGNKEVCNFPNQLIQWKFGWMKYFSDEIFLYISHIKKQN